MRIYVGNLPYRATTDELSALFEAHGEVVDIHIPTDRETGRPRGFAFVDMPNEEEAKAAVEALDGQDMGGRSIRVNPARPREEGGSRSDRSWGSR